MMLWQPTAPTPRDPLDVKYPNYGGTGGLDLATQLGGNGMAERFGMCKSGMQGKLLADNYYTLFTSHPTFHKLWIILTLDANL